jgi:hypothetical protein
VGDISENFSRSEFECSCGCGFDTVDMRLVEALEDERAYFTGIYGEGTTIKPTGKNRCYRSNERVQFIANPQYIPHSSKSMHMFAKASDHKVFKPDGSQVDPQEQYDYLDKKYPDSHGVGLYRNRVHLDTRADKARWGSA